MTAEKDATVVVDGHCFQCGSCTCPHAHAVEPDPACLCPGCQSSVQCHCDRDAIPPNVGCPKHRASIRVIPPGGDCRNRGNS